MPLPPPRLISILRLIYDSGISTNNDNYQESASAQEACLSSKEALDALAKLSGRPVGSVPEEDSRLSGFPEPPRSCHPARISNMTCSIFLSKRIQKDSAVLGGVWMVQGRGKLCVVGDDGVSSESLQNPEKNVFRKHETVCENLCQGQI